MLDMGKSNPETVRVQLNYPPEVVEQPIIYRLIKEYGLIPNIRRANIEMKTGGFLFLELTGDRDSLSRALAWIQSTGIVLDSIGLDGNQEWVV